MFTRKKFDPTRAPKLQMGNFSLDFSGEAKYLEVTLDSRLTFGPILEIRQPLRRDYSLESKLQLATSGVRHQ